MPGKLDLTSIVVKWALPAFVTLIAAVAVLQYQVNDIGKDIESVQTTLENVTDIRIELASRGQWMESINAYMIRSEQHRAKTDERIEFLMDALVKERVE